MGMVVRSNIMAINANRSLGVNNSQVSKNLEKLSSGFKINRAADDAAGLAISEKMKAQIKGLEQASLNSQDGISLVQTAEGALTEVHDMLNRMKELATKSGNGTIQDEVDRASIQNEVNKLNDEIDRISQSTNFNGINLLDGSLSAKGGSSGAASSIKVGGAGTLTDVAAVAGVYETNAAVALGTLTDGKVATFSVSLENGKSYTVNFAVSKNASGKFILTADDGTEYTHANATTTDVGQAELVNAFVKELGKTALGKDFKIENNTNKIKFTAKTAGTSIPAINGIGVAGADGAAQANKLDVTAASDAFQTLSGMTAYDGTNANSSIFTINGKKFAYINNDLTQEQLDALGKDVKTVALGTKDTIKKADADIMTKLINTNTGLGTENTLADGSAVGTDADNSVALKTGDGSVAGSGGLTLQIGDTGDAFNQVTVSVQDMSAKGIGTSGLDVSTQDTAKDAIDVIKEAINYVSTNRGELGALQNRLEHTINNLDVAAENMTAANSRIRDTDMAKQMMEYTKMNVLTQSAQAMLAQANQQPQSILQLLQ